MNLTEAQIPAPGRATANAVESSQSKPQGRSAPHLTPPRHPRSTRSTPAIPRSLPPGAVPHGSPCVVPGRPLLFGGAPESPHHGHKTPPTLRFLLDFLSSLGESS